MWRAATLSVTIDEAYSYNQYASGGIPGIYLSGFDANNHILHSTLLWISTSLFGLHELTLRLPALLGSLLFLFALPGLVERLVHGVWMQRLVFLILAVNPQTLDLLSVGRGYSLALAFMVLALRWLFDFADRQESKDLVRLSVAAGLCCCANLSFTFVCLAILCVASVVVVSRGRWRFLPKVWFPGVLLAAFLLSHPLSRALPGIFYWGAKDYRESLTATTTAFIQHDPQYDGPVVTGRTRARFERRFVPGALIILVGFAVLGFLRGQHHRQTTLIAIFAALLLGHWLAHVWFQALYPRERTGLAVVFLFFLGFGAVTSTLLERWTIPDRFIAIPSVAILLLILLQLVAQFDPAFYWPWFQERDNRKILSLLQQQRARRIACDWGFQPAFEFYRLAGRLPEAQPIPRFADGKVVGSGYDAYILQSPKPSWLSAAGLKIVWRNDVTGVTLAVPDPAGMVTTR